MPADSFYFGPMVCRLFVVSCVVFSRLSRVQTVMLTIGRDLCAFFVSQQP